MTTYNELKFKTIYYWPDYVPNAYHTAIDFLEREIMNTLENEPFLVLFKYRHKDFPNDNRITIFFTELLVEQAYVTIDYSLFAPGTLFYNKEELVIQTLEQLSKQESSYLSKVSENVFHLIMKFHRGTKLNADAKEWSPKKIE